MTYPPSAVCEAKNGTSCEECLKNVTVRPERRKCWIYFILSGCLMDKYVFFLEEA